MNDNIELATPAAVGTEKISTYLWITFGICFLSNILGGTVSTLMSVYLPVVVKALLGDVSDEHLSTVSAYINALYIFGWALGGVTWGIISDKIGRAKSLMLAVGCYGIFTGLISFASSWESVVIFRFFSGFGVGGVLVIAATFLSEVWPAKSRSIILGIISIGFPIGIFSAGLVNYLVSSWRQGFLFGLLPLSLAILSIWFLKESEKWKTARVESSRDSTRRYVKEYTGDLLKGAVLFGSMLIGLWAIFHGFPPGCKVC